MIPTRGVRDGDAGGLASWAGTSGSRKIIRPEDPLAGTKSLAQIAATGDDETRLQRYVSLLEVLLRDCILAEDQASGSLFRMVEALYAEGPLRRPVSFRALEFALNVRNAIVHPNSGLRQAAPVEGYEVRFACEVLDLAVRGLAESLGPELASRVRGDDGPGKGGS
jgi:hypothetical protein